METNYKTAKSRITRGLTTLIIPALLATGCTSSHYVGNGQSSDQSKKNRIGQEVVRAIQE